MTTLRRRNHLIQIVLICLVSALGLGSRRYARFLPAFIAAYAGDTLWALAAFLGIGLILPSQSTWRVAGLAFLFSVLIEVSQLYHASWIDSIRQTTLGGLILGFGFLWSDLACYAAGVALGVCAEAVLRRGSRSQRRDRRVRRANAGLFGFNCPAFVHVEPRTESEGLPFLH